MMPRAPKIHRVHRPYRKTTSSGLHGTNYRKWRKARLAYLSAHPLCVECDQQGRITEATNVDHIIDRRDGGEMWDWDNLQSLCQSCHSRKTRAKQCQSN